MKKRHLILLSILVVISIILSICNLNKSKAKEPVNNNNNNNSTVFNEIESKADTLENEDLANETNQEKEIIWIKNINVLAEKGENYNIIMTLKSKLNEELKTIDKDIYEVNLIEDTYEKNEQGFKIKANVDKLENPILIEYSNYVFTFTHTEND